MRVSTMLATAGAILTLSAGAAFAAEACGGCNDVAADSPMSCCDEMKSKTPPAEPVPPAPAPSDAPTPQGHADHH